MIAMMLISSTNILNTKILKVFIRNNFMFQKIIVGKLLKEAF